MFWSAEQQNYLSEETLFFTARTQGWSHFHFGKRAREKKTSEDWSAIRLRNGAERTEPVPLKEQLWALCQKCFASEIVRSRKSLWINRLRPKRIEAHFWRWSHTHANYSSLTSATICTELYECFLFARPTCLLSPRRLFWFFWRLLINY